MTFEEEFPGLKGKCNEPYSGRSGLDFELVEDNGYVHIVDIQEHCLDKQKVKEALQCAVFAIRELGRLAIYNGAHHDKIWKLQEDRVQQIRSWTGLNKKELGLKEDD